MFKELRFDVVGAIKRTDKYDGEWEAIHNFNASEHMNMAIDYDTEKDAHNACQWVRKMVERERMNLKVALHRKKTVLVEKR